MSMTKWLNPGTPNPPSDAANIIGDIVVAFWQRTAFLASANVSGVDDAQIIELYSRLHLELSWAQASGINVDEIFAALTARFGPTWDSHSVFGSMLSTFNGAWLRIRRAGILPTPLSDAEECAFGEALVALRQGDPYLVDTNITMLTELRAGRGLVEEVDWNVRIYAFRDFIPFGIVF